MRGFEASGPGALWAAPSTLTTSVISSTTGLPTTSSPIPSTDTDLVASNIEHVLLAITSRNQDGGLASVGGNTSGSTGKGILIGILSAFGSAAVAVVILAVFFFFKYTRRGRIILDRIGRPGEYDDEQAFLREEAEALEAMDDLSRSEYARAKGKCELVLGLEQRCCLACKRLSSTNNGCSFYRSQPPRVDANRHLAVSVPCDPRKRCIRVGVPAGTGNCQLFRGGQDRD